MAEPEQPGGLAVDVRERGQLLDLVELESSDLAIGVLAHEHQVDDPDRVVLHEMAQGESDITRKLVAGKRMSM
jgi:hypothetical protein